MKKIIVIILALFISACAVQQGRMRLKPDTVVDGKLTERGIQQQLEDDVSRYLILVEEALVHRQKIIEGYHKIRIHLDKDEALTGEDLEILNEGALKHLNMRERLYKYVYAYEDWLDNSPKGMNESLRLQGVMLSLSAALLLYDNYMLAVTVFEEDGKLRRYLNSRHQGYNIGRSQLTAITLSYNSLENRHRMRKAKKHFQSNWYKQPENFRELEENQYLYLLITQSPSYNISIKFSPLFMLNRYIKFLSAITVDTLTDIKNDGINLFSLAFGNSVGLIQSRRGYLRDKQEYEEYLQSHLQAGDILLEKTPFRLTDKLIPGYWGHVAVWVGAEDELKRLKIWNHPVVKPYRDNIRQGQSVAEALRPGVVLNALPEFLDIDDLAVVRYKNLSDQQKAAVVLRTLRQIGKPFDFNFDIELNDRVICSELVYIAYSDIKWPTQNTLGRYTVSPSHIAEKVGSEGVFEVIALFLGGKMVTTGIQDKFIQLK